MISFQKYLVNEMPKALKDAALQGDVGKFKNELKQAFFKTKSSLDTPGTASYHFQGASNVVIHDGGGDGERMWPYMTFDVKKPDGSTAKITVSVPDEEDITNIADFNFEVDGQKKKFATTTSQEQKRTGDIAAGASYILHGLKQSIFGGAKRKANAAAKRATAIEGMSDDELKAILAARAGTDAPKE